MAGEPVLEEKNYLKDLSIFQAFKEQYLSTKRKIHPNVMPGCSIKNEEENEKIWYKKGSRNSLFYFTL